MVRGGGGGLPDPYDIDAWGLRRAGCAGGGRAASEACRAKLSESVSTEIGEACDCGGRALGDTGAGEGRENGFTGGDDADTGGGREAGLIGGGVAWVCEEGDWGWVDGLKACATAEGFLESDAADCSLTPPDPEPAAAASSASASNE